MDTISMDNGLVNTHTLYLSMSLTQKWISPRAPSVAKFVRNIFCFEKKKICNTPRERELKSSRLKTNKQTHMHWPNILQPSFFWRLQFATVRKSSLIWYLCCKLRGYLEGVKSITGAHTLVFNNAKSSFIRFDTYRYEHKNIIIIIIQIPFFIFIFFNLDMNMDNKFSANELSSIDSFFFVFLFTIIAKYIQEFKICLSFQQICR